MYKLRKQQENQRLWFLPDLHRQARFTPQTWVQQSAARLQQPRPFLDLWLQGSEERRGHVYRQMWGSLGVWL